VTKRKEKNSREKESVEDKVFTNMPKELEKKFLKLCKKYKISKKTLTGSFQNLIIKFIELTIKVLFDKEDLKVLVELIEYINSNTEKIFLDSNTIDKEVYKLMKNVINNAISINREKIKDALSSYLKSVSTKESTDTIIQTVLLNRDWYYGVLPLSKKRSIIDLIQVATDLFETMLENRNEMLFRYYFFDWVLKLGYLLEAYIKEILIVYLKSICVCKNDLLKRYNQVMRHLERRHFTLGAVLTELITLDKNFIKDKGWANLRNSIFHTSFELNYEINFQDRNITFIYNEKGVDKGKIITIVEFIDHFYYLTKICTTFNVVLLNFVENPNLELFRQLYNALYEETNKDDPFKDFQHPKFTF